MQEASQANFVPFTEEMRRTHTILVPGMLPIHFSLMQAAFTSCGYKVEVLQDTGHEVVETGLKYVNNDICYPALLVIGQLLHALESGKYDLNKTPIGSLLNGEGYNHEYTKSGEIIIDEDSDGKLFWRCPNCGNTDQTKMNVCRRTCGKSKQYLPQ